MTRQWRPPHMPQPQGGVGTADRQGPVRRRGVWEAGPGRRRARSRSERQAQALRPPAPATRSARRSKPPVRRSSSTACSGCTFVSRHRWGMHGRRNPHRQAAPRHPPRRSTRPVADEQGAHAPRALSPLHRPGGDGRTRTPSRQPQPSPSGAARQAAGTSAGSAGEAASRGFIARAQGATGARRLSLAANLSQHVPPRRDGSVYGATVRQERPFRMVGYQAPAQFLASLDRTLRREAPRGLRYSTQRSQLP